MNSETNYYRTRERAERKAADEARSLAARRIHSELAEAYARLIQR